MATRTGASNVAYLAGDSEGTSTVAIDSQTLDVTRRYYDPYGNPIGTAPVSFPAGQKGFVGGTADPATSLTNLGARQYESSLGSFITTDSVLKPYDPQDLNPYAYAEGNPSTLSDPTGTSSTSTSAPLPPGVTQSQIQECESIPDPDKLSICQYIQTVEYGQQYSILDGEDPSYFFTALFQSLIPQGSGQATGKNSGGCNGDGTGTWVDNSNPNFALCEDPAEGYDGVDISTALLEALSTAMGKHVVVVSKGVRVLQFVGGAIAVIAAVVAIFVKNHPLAAIIVAAIAALVVVLGGPVVMAKWLKGVVYSIKKAVKKIKNALPITGVHLHVDLDCLNLLIVEGCVETKVAWWNDISTPGPWGVTK
jgi:RHS repeat-associated protein